MLAREDDMTTSVPTPEPPRIRLGHLPLTPVTMEEALAHIAAWVGREPFRLVVTPNVDHVIRLRDSLPFREAYDAAVLSLADGAPIVWAARWLGLPPIEKVSGSDLAPRLCTLAAERGWRVFFAGGQSPDDLAARLDALRAVFPGLVAGGVWPPHGFDTDPDQSARIVEEAASFGADLFLMACGSPKSEIWLNRHRDHLARGVGISIGAALDFMTGRRRRAPAWMQRAGLEWSWRLAREPRRLARRYLWDDLRFFPMVWQWKRDQRH